MATETPDPVGRAGDPGVEALLAWLSRAIDPYQLFKVRFMLRRPEPVLWAEVSEEAIRGIVRSQRTGQESSAAELTADGSACLDGQGKRCGNQGGVQPCKHVLTLALALVQEGKLTGAEARVRLERVWSSTRASRQPADLSALRRTRLNWLAHRSAPGHDT